MRGVGSRAAFLQVCLQTDDPAGRVPTNGITDTPGCVHARTPFAYPAATQELRGKLDASRQEVEKLEAQLQEVGSQHSKELQEQEEKVRMLTVPLAGAFVHVDRHTASWTVIQGSSGGALTRIGGRICRAYPGRVVRVHQQVVAAASSCLVLLQHHAELAAAERTAAEAVEAERARSSQLQQQLAELAASSAEQHRTLQAQLHEANLQLVARGDEVAVLTTQLQQAQEGLTGRDADISRLQAELLQVNTGCLAVMSSYSFAAQQPGFLFSA